MTDDAPDYTTMSGAEMRRAVGADPVKWAAAYLQYRERHVRDGYSTDAEQWFRDAMDAARAEGQRLGRIGGGE
jgi:hypothetical protein